MPLAGRRGPPEPPIADILLLPVAQVEESLIDHQPYIEDTFINKTAFNPETYADTFKLLQRYSSGSRISVTYFLRSTPTSSVQRADSIDPSSLRSSTQTSYTEIKQFEIVIQSKGLQTGFSQDNQESKITGEALLYPGMKPRIGDLFITPIGDSTFGIFQVTSVDRLTYRQGSNHKITFFLREYASDDGVAIIRRSVTKTVWFDKETYLGDATTLLKEDSYICLKTMRQMRGILIRHYYNTFYDKQMNSIIAPDGTYDPYLVNYLNGKISLMDSIHRPAQLYPTILNYENCIWSRLTEVTNRTLFGLQAENSLVRCRVSRWDVSITSLANRVMVLIDNPNKQAMEAPTLSPNYNVPSPPTPSVVQSLQPISTGLPYVFSANFYAGDKVAMTPFEFMIHAVIQDRKIIKLRDFIDGFLNRYAELTYAQQYYYIPLYLWLIDVGIDGIGASDSFMT
jgi:hypothetical protein